MSGGEILSLIVAVSALLGVVLVFITNRRANKTGEKKLTLDEQVAEDARKRSISEERRIELERLYLRVEKLELALADLQKRDEQKQKTIDTQAVDLERTTDALEGLRGLFVAFVKRVEQAWSDGHSMPTLTEHEQALLEMTLPVTHSHRKDMERFK